MMRRAFLVFACCCCVFALGCGPSLVPVRGVVTLDGEPVADAAVSFIRQPTGENAIGMTNEEGEFSLKTTKLGDGVLPGEHVVVVSCVKYVGATEQADGVEGTSAPITENWITPQHYAEPTTSGLTQEVVKGMQPVKIELKSN